MIPKFVPPKKTWVGTDDVIIGLAIMMSMMIWELKRLVFLHLKAMGWDRIHLLNAANKSFWMTALSSRMRMLCRQFGPGGGQMDFAFGCKEQEVKLMRHLPSVSVGTKNSALFRALIVLTDMFGFSEVLNYFFRYEWSVFFTKEEFGTWMKNWYFTNCFKIVTHSLVLDTKTIRRMVRSINYLEWEFNKQIPEMKKLLQEFLSIQARSSKGEWKRVEKFKTLLYQMTRPLGGFRLVTRRQQQQHVCSTARTRPVSSQPSLSPPPPSATSAPIAKTIPAGTEPLRPPCSEA